MATSQGLLKRFCLPGVLVLAGLLLITPKGFCTVPPTPLSTVQTANKDDIAPLTDDIEYETGVVLSVEKLSAQNIPGFSRPFGSMNEVQQADVQVTSGPLTGQVVRVRNLLSGHPAYDIKIAPGSRVLLSIEKLPGHPPDINIADRARTPAITLCFGLFLLGFMILGGKRGLKSLGLLVLCGLLLGSLLMPMILQGIAPQCIVLIMALIFVTLGSVFLLPAFQGKAPNPRALIIILGSMGGLLLTLGWMSLMAWLAPLDGFSNESLAALWQSSPQVDFQGVLIASALLANLGLLFHLCQTIVQTYPEEGFPEGFQERFHLALGIGRDQLATLMNAVVLLYLGLFFPLLFQLLDTPSIKFLNLESTASLLCTLLAGGLGLLMTVPWIAALIGWYLPHAPKNETLKP